MKKTHHLRRYATDGEVGLAVNQVLRLREFESLYLHKGAGDSK